MSAKASSLAWPALKTGASLSWARWIRGFFNQSEISGGLLLCHDPGCSALCPRNSDSDRHERAAPDPANGQKLLLVVEAAQVNGGRGCAVIHVVSSSAKRFGRGGDPLTGDFAQPQRAASGKCGTTRIAVGIGFRLVNVPQNKTGRPEASRLPVGPQSPVGGRCRPYAALTSSRNRLTLPRSVSP